jgi:hypothetical protein
MGVYIRVIDEILAKRQNIYSKSEEMLKKQ